MHFKSMLGLKYQVSIKDVLSRPQLCDQLCVGGLDWNLRTLMGSLLTFNDESICVKPILQCM